MANRIKKAAALLDRYGIDAMLVTGIASERYVLGFRGKGTLIITADQAFYSVDGRYIEAAHEQVTDADIALADISHSHLDLAKRFVLEKGIRVLGYEEQTMSAGQYARYSSALPCRLVPCQSLIGSLRESKDPEELRSIRQAQKITDEAFADILGFIKPGVKEREIAARLVYEMFRRGGQRLAFNPIVAAGPNGSHPHAVFGARRVERGMFVTMDFGCMVDGYCSDMTRTVAVGEPTEEMEKVYQTVLAAQEAGIRAARSGIPGRCVDQAARAVIEAAGYGSYFGHNFGHSIGLENHEEPNASPTEERLFAENAVISAEPGIYLPGKFGVRIEDLLILSPDGYEDITASPRQLIVLS